MSLIDLRNQLYNHLQKLSYAFHDRSQTGQLMSRATSDVEGVRMFVGFALLRGVYFIVLGVAIIVLLMAINWKLALISHRHDTFYLLPHPGHRPAVPLAVYKNTAGAGCDGHLYPGKHRRGQGGARFCPGKIRDGQIHETGEGELYLGHHISKLWA